MDAVALAIRFNAFISAGNLDGLAGMMTADHIFVDTAGTVIAGRAACTEAWHSFFKSFPGLSQYFQCRPQ
jgi:ketosteroid isomerase-like protein